MTSKIAAMQARFELTEKQKEIQALSDRQLISQARIEKGDIVRNALLIGLVGILAFSAVVAVSYRRQLVVARVLGQKTKELERALEEIDTLRGLIPICSYCKKIRDDEGIWHLVDVYVRKHSEAEFSHGICPDCVDAALGELGACDEH